MSPWPPHCRGEPYMLTELNARKHGEWERMQLIGATQSNQILFQQKRQKEGSGGVRKDRNLQWFNHAGQKCLSLSLSCLAACMYCHGEEVQITEGALVAFILMKWCLSPYGYYYKDVWDSGVIVVSYNMQNLKIDGPCTNWYNQNKPTT